MTAQESEVTANVNSMSKSSFRASQAALNAVDFLSARQRPFAGDALSGKSLPDSSADGADTPVCTARPWVTSLQCVTESAKSGLKHARQSQNPSSQTWGRGEGRQGLGKMDPELHPTLPAV